MFALFSQLSLLGSQKKCQRLPQIRRSFLTFLIPTDRSTYPSTHPYTEMKYKQIKFPNSLPLIYSVFGSHYPYSIFLTVSFLHLHVALIFYTSHYSLKLKITHLMKKKQHKRSRLVCI